jgi:uncharacterized RDD family membrane protein YckC
MASESGYLSEQDKQRFTIVAGVLGFVFFLLQVLVPMIVMFATMPFSLFGTFEVTSFERSGMAWSGGRMYAVESSQKGGFAEMVRHDRLVRIGSGGLEPVADLGDWEPALLAAPSGLYLISSTAVGTLGPEGISKVEPESSLGEISRPFLLDGRPAVVESRPDGRRLVVWTGGAWIAVAAYPDSGSSTCSQYLAPAGEPLEFRCKGSSLFVRDLGRPSTGWKLVDSHAPRWWSFTMDAGPAVLVASESGGLRLLAPRDGKWAEIRSSKGFGTLISESAAFQQAPEGPLTVVSTGMPGSFRVGEWSASGLTETFRTKGTFPFPGRMFGIMWIAQFSPIALSLLLAVILSALMRAHRVPDYRLEERRVPFASLTRRALAQIVDLVFVAAPGPFLMARFFGGFEDFFDSPTAFLKIFAWMGVAVAWALVVFLVFSLTEGLRGVTPGKWLTGIRVVGADLRPCGVGRALVRNLLKVVDGFFNFLVGLLLVAFTPEWQRLGDLAARTVVVRTGRDGLAALAAPPQG